METTHTEWKAWPFEYVKAGSVTVFGFLHGLFRFIRMGNITVITICGVAVLACIPSPEVLD